VPALRQVLFNALYLDPGVSGGPETYLRGLVPAIAAEFPELRVLVATTRAGAASLRSDGWEDFSRVLELPCDDGERLRRQWAEQVLLPRVARSTRADIVHSLASIAPLRPGTRSVVTLHDVTFLVRRTFGRVTTAGMSTLVRAAARRADALITATAAARDEICTVLGLAPQAFTIVPHGYDLARAAEATSADVLRERYALGEGRVVLCVAAKRPHKNQGLLVQAAPMLDGDVRVVLAGHAEPYEQQLRELARARGVEDRVRFLGYVSDEDLEGLWRLAACAALPTLGEGFGIPLLEALAHGVPVACSGIPVLREVGGDLPHYFDPHDPGDAAGAIAAAMADGIAAARGPAHAAAFTWAAAARGTYSAYERAMARPGR
jgi:glycosyltransferase involved in cell wall biosynthesis